MITVAAGGVRKPFNWRPGYVCSRRTGPLQADRKRGWVVVYNGDRARAEGEQVVGKWIVACETHGQSTHVGGEKRARALMKAGSVDFCSACSPTGRAKVLPDATPEQRAAAVAPLGARVCAYCGHEGGTHPFAIVVRWAREGGVKLQVPDSTYLHLGCAGTVQDLTGCSA